MEQLIQIKGVREGLLVTLGEGNWPEIQELMLNHFDQQADFLKGAKLYIDVGSHTLHAVELSKMRDAVSDRGLVLWGIISSSNKTEQTAQLLGLATRLSKPPSKIHYRNITSTDTSLVDGESAVLVQRTLRSGFSLKNPANIIVLGDVNPGAEIIAGGSIIVWGRLRGTAHAGIDGNESAQVCALNLTPTQLRIAEQIYLNRPQKGTSGPEIAFIKDGKLVVQQWKMGRK